VTVDALEYLRSQDPVPHGSSAPPMEWVLARIEREAARPARRRRRPRLALMPTLAVAATVAVVAAVVVLAVTHRAHTPAHVPPATRTTPSVRPLPSPDSLMPPGGMRGTLFIQGAASGSGGHALINFTQCQPCHAHGTGPTRLWQATTNDGGGSWHVGRTAADLSLLALSGADGWAEGIGADRVARFFASHDGGRTWHVASSDAVSGGGVGDVSIAAGEVWSLGCTGANRCTDTVLRAPASSDHLSKTSGQPPLGDTTDVSVVAAGRDDAFVLTDDYATIGKTEAITATRLFATHDGGATWRRMAPACPTRAFGTLYAGGTNSLWALCQPMHGPSDVWRSTDGGAHWTTLSSRLGTGDELEPASARVAWATTPAGKVFRTSDGGRSWTRAWYAGHPEPSAPTNAPPGLNRRWNIFLTVQSPTTATVIVQVSRGHGPGGRTGFVTYRTTDGGRTWRPSVVRLPAG
jgi:hypothetical protein